MVLICRLFYEKGVSHLDQNVALTEEYLSVYTENHKILLNSCSPPRYLSI